MAVQGLEEKLMELKKMLGPRTPKLPRALRNGDPAVVMMMTMMIMMVIKTALHPF